MKNRAIGDPYVMKYYVNHEIQNSNPYGQTNLKKIKNYIYIKQD